MKYTILIISILLMAVINVPAAKYLSGETVKVAFIDTVDEDIFAGCRNVNIFGYVDGDIYAGCENVIIEGKVEDDVIVGCRSLSVTGIVNDGIIVGAETIVIDGIVRGDVIAFGRTVRVTEGAQLSGNLFVGCGELLLEGGPVAGFVKGTAGYAKLNAPIGGKVELEVEHFEFGDEYAAGKRTSITVPHDFDESGLSYVPPDFDLSYKSHVLFFEEPFLYWFFMALLVTGILIIFIFKNFSRDFLTYAGINLPANTGIGLIFLIATPIALSIFSVFIVTIPVTLILLSLYFIVLYLSFVFTGMYIGDFLLAQIRKGNGGYTLFWPLVVGLLIISLLPQIPYIGWLINIAFISFGSGSLIMYIWSIKKAEKTLTE